MSYNNGPKLVTSGLILNYDPGSTKSYVSGSTSLTSLSINTYTASLVGGVGYSTSSKGYFIFDGTNDYISATTYTNPSSSLSSKTINLWFRQNERNTASDEIAGLFSIMSASADPQLGIRTNTTSSYLSGSVTALPIVYLDTFTNGPSTQYTISSSFFYDKWYMVTGVDDVTNNRLSLYLDGQLVRTGSRSGSAYQYNADRIQIGAEKLSSNRYFNGDIGTCGLYNTALSATQIKDLYEFGRLRYLSDPNVYADLWLTFEIDSTGMSTALFNANDNTTSGSWSNSGAQNALIFSSSLDASFNRISKVNNRTCKGKKGMFMNYAYGGDHNYYTYNFDTPKSKVSFSMYLKYPFIGGFGYICFFYPGGDTICAGRSGNNDIYYIADMLSRLNTWYRLDVLFEGGKGYTRHLYDITGSLVGQSFASSTATTISNFRFGWFSPGNYGFSGSLNFDNLIVDWTYARFPLIA
jgi:hypothetical protein